MIKNSIGDRNTFRKLHVKSFQELKVRFFFNRMSYSVYRLQIIDKNIGVEKQV